MKTQMTTDRAKQIICNLLNEVATKTDFPKEQWEDWLSTEVGLSASEINELKEDNLFREPEFTEAELNELQ